MTQPKQPSFRGDQTGITELGQGRARQQWAQVDMVRISTGRIVATLYTRGAMGPAGGQTWFRLCGTCDGTGHRAGYEHVENGRCWPCTGHGAIQITGKVSDWLRKH